MALGPFRSLLRWCLPQELQILLHGGVMCCMLDDYLPPRRRNSCSAGDLASTGFSVIGLYWEDDADPPQSWPTAHQEERQPLPLELLARTALRWQLPGRVPQACLSLLLLYSPEMLANLHLEKAVGACLPLLLPASLCVAAAHGAAYVPGVAPAVVAAAACDALPRTAKAAQESPQGFAPVHLHFVDALLREAGP